MGNSLHFDNQYIIGSIFVETGCKCKCRAVLGQKHLWVWPGFATLVQVQWQLSMAQLQNKPNQNESSFGVGMHYQHIELRSSVMTHHVSSFHSL